MTDYTDLLGLDPEAPAVDPQNPQPFVPGIGSQNVDNLPKVEGPGIWESIKGGFAIGREDDSTLNAIDRIDAESNFKPDPNYRLEQNHSDLMEDVPLHWQPILNEQLADARSLQHSWYIRNQTMHELENSQKAATFGAWGMLGRLGAGIVDEGALTLAAIGPLAAVARAAKTASVIGTMARLKRVGAFATAGAVENLGLEAIVAQGSKTRTPEDLAYAAAFGAIFGGAAGALSIPRARAPAPDVEPTPGAVPAPGAAAGAAEAAPVPEGLDVAPPKPTELDGVQVQEPDMASMGERHIKELDNSIEKDLKGEGAPLPEHPVVNQFADEMNAVNSRELGIDDTPAPVRPIDPEAAAAAKQAAKQAAAEVRRAAKQAAKDEARLEAIDVRMQEIADADVAKPVRPTLLDEMDRARETVARAKAVLESEGANKVERTRADQELQQTKRHLMKVLKEQATDDYLKHGLSANPKTAEFLKFMESKAEAIAKRANKAYEKELSGYERTLDRMEKELDKLRGEGEEIRLRREQAKGAPKAEPKAETFGEDSAGAAAATTRGADLLKMDEAAISEILDNAPEMTAAAKGRAGGYAITNRSPNAVVRWLGDKLYHDAVGTADGSKVGTPSALARAQVHEDVVLGNFLREYNVAFRGWLKDNGTSTWRRHDDQLQEEFGELVGNAIELGSNDPNVSKAAKAASKAFEETHKYAERSGVVGFDQFKHRDDYLPHIHNSEAFIAANRDLQLVGVPQRAPAWGAPHEVIYQGFKRAGLDLEDAIAIRFATRYVDTVMRKAEGLNGRMFDLSRTVDPEYLRSILDEIKMDPADVDHFMYRVQRSTKAQQAGASPRAKHRALLDMDTTISVRDESGRVREFKITELYHRNAVRLVHSYVRNVGGLAAIADVTKGTPIHLNSLQKIDDLFTKMAELEHDTAITADRGMLLNRSLASEQEALRIGINTMIGQPVNDYSKLGNRIGMRLKNFNFTSLMGQTAFAQMSEMGSYVAHVGWVRTLKTIPEMRSMLSRDEFGNLRNELGRVAEEFLGAGTTAMRGRSFSPHMTDVEAVTGRRAYWMDRAMHKGKLITGAPMHAVMTLQQRALNVNMMQKWGDIAMGRAKLADWERARLHQVGLSDADMDAIAAQYKKYARFEGGDGKLLNPNFDQWDNFDSFVKLRDAMFQITRRVVQENDPSNVPPLMSKMGWSILTQFKNFVIGAYEKHLLNNVNALRRSGGKDFEAWANFAYQTFFAGIAYYAMVKGKTIGMDEKRKRKYEKEMLSPEKIGLNAFARTGFSSVIPTLVDTSASMAGFDSLFSGSRGSGLDQNLITGSASYSTLMHVAGAGRSVIASALNPDYKFSTRDLRDWQYALPFATLPGIYNLWNVIDDVANLPSRSKER